MGGSGTGTPATGAGTVIPATITCLTLVSDALTEIGWLAQGETPTYNDGDYCRRRLNRMLDSWATRGLYCYYLDHTNHTFTTSAQSYTIGASGADFTAARPEHILKANLMSSDGYRTPLYVVEWPADYGRITAPATSGTPNTLYYQPTVPNGVLYPYPYPTDTASGLELFTTVALQTYSALNTAYHLPPGYQEAITCSLAELLCTAYGRPLTPELVTAARNARVNIQAVNNRTPLLLSDYPDGADGDFDHHTGNLA